MSSSAADIPKELRSPSEALLTASESIGLYWWYWEKPGGKLNISPGLLKILGVAPESFDGLPQSIYLNIHPEDVERNKVRIDRLYRGQDDLYELEYRVRDPKGGWLWYYNRGTVLQKDKRGKALVIGGISMDISGPFTKLLAMVEEKEKFEFIFRHSTEAILVLEFQDGKVKRVRDANRAALDLFHRSDKDILSEVPTQFASDDMLGTGGTMIQQIKEKGFARFEKKIAVSGGQTRWLEFTAHGFSLTGEDLIITIVTDKTSGKKAEAALRETEKLYRTLFEAANDRIGLYTVDGKAALLNSAFYKSLGYTRKEFLTIDQQALIHPADRERIEKESKDLGSKGFSAHEYRVLHKNGTYLHMSSKVVVIKGEEGEEDLVLFIMRDISERRQFIKDLERAKERAEESDKLKSAFLANMSHEIRTPMNSIIGFSNLLNKADLNSEERELYIDRIVSNSEMLLTLITDIIDLAKIESGQVTMNYGRLLLSDLIAEMKQHACDEAKRLHKEHLEITTKVEVGDCEVEADVLRLTQVLKNLINNAVKFTQEGNVEIGCTLGASGQTVVLYVRDTGIGIAPEHFDLIFDQFRQVDGSNTRKFGGTGLGLSICRNLIMLMGGRIWVESELGSGALFQVELPLRSPGIRKQHPAPVEQDSGVSESKLEVSILAVDDEPHTLELYQALLNAMGHSVRMAGNGYEALRILEQFPLPDLVLMDVQMPVLSGTDTLRIIRERYPDVKVVAQSAHALVGDRERFMKEGYDEYLPKPFTTGQMKKVISNLMGA
jgi:PAS domain S-box-containing protein